MLLCNPSSESQTNKNEVQKHTRVGYPATAEANKLRTFHVVKFLSQHEPFLISLSAYGCATCLSGAKNSLASTITCCSVMRDTLCTATTLPLNPL